MRFIAIPRQSQELSLKEFLAMFFSFFSRKNQVAIFEEKFAKFVGVRKAIAFHSLRQGLFCVLKSLGFKKNDGIIVPAYGYFAIPATIIQAGLKPIFVDIKPKDHTLDVTKLKKAITPKTKAILVVHLNGYPADMEEIMAIAQKHKLRVIEDCAHACGAEYEGRKVGSFDIGCFSFGLGKPLSTAGGGMITTNDRKLAKKLRVYQQSFEEIDFFKKSTLIFKIFLVRIFTLPFVFFFTGYPLLLLSQAGALKFLSEFFKEKISFSKKIPQSYKLKFSNLQAALGIEQLKQVNKRNQIRINNANLLNRQLRLAKNIQLPNYSPDRKNIYLHYLVRIKMKNIDNFVRNMLLRRINVQKDYCSDCSSLEIFKKFRTKSPMAARLSQNIFYLPNHPSVGEKEAKYIAKRLKEVLV